MSCVPIYRAVLRVSRAFHALLCLGAQWKGVVIFMNDIHLTRIDQISAIDLNAVTTEDIRWRYGTMTSTSTGSKRDRTYKSSHRHGVMTALGDIQVDIWYQVAEHIVRRDGEEWLLAALNEWEQAHNYAQRSQKQLYYDALQSFSHRVFDNPQWVNFIPFNQAYRADVLKQAQIVTVVNSCCGKPGNVTQQQIDHAYESRIACPHCGRWSTFSIVDGKAGHGWKSKMDYQSGDESKDVLCKG